MLDRTAPWLLGAMVGLVCAIVQSAQVGGQERTKIEIVPNNPHSLGIKSAAVSRDGKRLVSGGRDNTVKLWDAATGRLLRTFEGHSDYVTSVAFSPDGARLLSGSDDKTLKLWDAASGQLIRSWEAQLHDVTAVAFAPDGRYLLSAGSGDMDSSVKLWDAQSGQLVRMFGAYATYELEGTKWHGSVQGRHTNSVNSVAFSTDGTRLVSGSDDKTVKLWDVSSGQLIRTLEGHSSRVRSVAYSPDGSRVLSGGTRDGELRLWDAATGQPIHVFKVADWTSSVAFSPDGTRLLSGGPNGARLWDAASGGLLHTFRGHELPVEVVAFLPNGKHLITGGDPALKLWDAASGQLLRTFAGASRSVRSVAFSPDGTRLLSGGDDHTLKLWDAASGRLVRTFVGHANWLLSVAFSPDGTRLLSGSEDRTLNVWDAASGQVIDTLSHPSPIQSVAISPDGTRLLSASGKTINLWNAASGQLVRTFEAHPGLVSSVSSAAFSPDGTRLLTGGNILISGTSGDQTLKLWDTSTGQLVRALAALPDSVTAVAFSPDGAHLLSGGRKLKLWDAASGQVLRSFAGHSGPIDAVTFSPDGLRLLSGSWDKTLKLWDAASGQMIRTFAGHSGWVNSVAFSPDGTRVLSGSNDSTARVWSTASGQHLASLFGSSDGGWLTITPEGFFDASAKGADILTIVRDLELTTIDQVHQSLFNPDLVRESLAGDPNGEVRDSAKVINLGKVLGSGPAPNVVITSPSDGGQSVGDLATIGARIEDRGKGIGRIEWRVNGITAAVSAKPAGRGPAYTTKQQLALDPGDNTIEVVAYNASNLLASPPARTTIRFTGPADGTKPKLHILAIGIDSDVDKGWTPPGAAPLAFAPLGLAVKDAEAFAASMKKAAAGLYGEVRITLALDTQATRDSLEQLIGKVSAEVHPRDSFMLFAAGHGTSEDGRFYFIPQDYQGGPGRLAQHAIGQDRLQDWLANHIKAKRAIILLDTCESGALVAGHARSRADAPASEAAVGRLHEATGRPVLTAAAAGQFAHEGLIGETGERHGVFTWALLDALRKGDANGNGTIELSELVRHVQSMVPKIAADLGGTGRAATSEPVSGKQAARFGSRGEDFAVARRLH
jgi:WD40 repeat protein